MTITGNRVGRCLTTSRQDSGGGYVCASGADSSGYWPRGGHYGISADLGSNATWSNNVWDDNGAGVCANGNAGCGGGTTPPPPADKPAVAVWTAPTGVVAGTAVSLNGSSSTGDAPITCTWTREDSAGAVLETKTGCQLSYTFANSGTQYLRLTVKDVDGDSNSSRKTISVAPATTPPPADKPAVAVWTAPTGVVAGTAVSLNGSSSTGDAPITCTWTREDSAGAVLETKTGCQLSYTFANSGTQYLRLTVKDVDGDSNSSRKTISVAPATTPPPADKPAVAVWTAPTGVVAGTAVSLNGSSSTGDAPITCTWTREDSAGAVLETKTGCQLSYTFANSGTQYLRLTVKDVDGDSNSSRKTISVAPATTPPPADDPADAVWTAPTGVVAGTPVTLNGGGSSGDAPLTCTWTVESLSGTVLDTKTGCRISYTFENSGTQYVRLTVRDSDRESDSNRKKINVAAAPGSPGGGHPEVPTTPPTTPPTAHPASAVWTPPSARVGRLVTLDGSGSQGVAPLTCIWTFQAKDGSATSVAQSGCSISHRFRKAGVEYVTLTVTGANGSTASSRQAVRVHATPNRRSRAKARKTRSVSPARGVLPRLPF